MVGSRSGPKGTPRRSNVSSGRCVWGLRHHAWTTWTRPTSARAVTTRGSRSDSALMDQLKSKIRHVPDFPKAGILFYDITTLLQDPLGLRLAIDSLVTPFADQGIDLVVG